MVSQFDHPPETRVGQKVKYENTSCVRERVTVRVSWTMRARWYGLCRRTLRRCRVMPENVFDDAETKEMTVLQGSAISVGLYLKRRGMCRRRRDGQSYVTIRRRWKDIRYSLVRPPSKRKKSSDVSRVHEHCARISDVCGHCASERQYIVLHRIVGVQYMVGTKRSGGGH